MHTFTMGMHGGQPNLSTARIHRCVLYSKLNFNISLSAHIPDKQEVQSLVLEATPFLSISKKPQGIRSLMEGSV